MERINVTSSVGAYPPSPPRTHLLSEVGTVRWGVFKEDFCSVPTVPTYNTRKHRTRNGEPPPPQTDSGRIPNFQKFAKGRVRVGTGGYICPAEPTRCFQVGLQSEGLAAYDR